MAEPIEMPFGMLSWVDPRNHVDIDWRDLANVIEPPICNGDAALCQITLTTCFHYITYFSYFVCMNADTSLMSVHCNQAGCPNMCSVFVYPYCYEHIETKISEHRGNAEQSPKGVYDHFFTVGSALIGTFAMVHRKHA